MNVGHQLVAMALLFFCFAWNAEADDLSLSFVGQTPSNPIPFGQQIQYTVRTENVKSDPQAPDSSIGVGIEIRVDGSTVRADSGEFVVSGCSIDPAFPFAFACNDLPEGGSQSPSFTWVNPQSGTSTVSFHGSCQRVPAQTPPDFCPSFGITVSTTTVVGMPTANAGVLDTTFDSDGIVITELQGTNITETAEAIAVQPDGKILVAGTWSTNSFALARYLSNGALDSGFGTNGVIITPSGFVADIVLQPNGRILLAGTEGNTDFKVVRYLPDGALDTSFGTDGIALATMSATNAEARGVALSPDGKITVVGYAEVSAGIRDYAVARFNSDGSPDTAFDSDGKVITDLDSSSNDFGQAVALQADGKILVTGHANGVVGLVRYNEDGSIDNSLGTNGIVTTDVSVLIGATIGGSEDVYAVATQPDGKILVAGSSISAGNSRGLMVVRYDTDGSLDNTFGTSGMVVTVVPGGGGYQSIADIAVQPDGKIVAAGDYVGTAGAPNDIDFVLVRYNASGALDTSFDGDGIAVLDLGSTNERCAGLAIQPDGKILVAGSTANDYAVLRYDAFTLDITPAALTFVDETDVAMSEVQTSNIVTVNGLDGSVRVPVSVAGGEYALNGSTAYTSGISWVANGDQVNVRHTSASTENTTVSTALRVGGVMAPNGITHIGTSETATDSYDTTTLSTPGDTSDGDSGGGSGGSSADWMFLKVLLLILIYRLSRIRRSVSV